MQAKALLKEVTEGVRALKKANQEKAELKQPKAEASKEEKLDKDASLLHTEEKLGTQAEGQPVLGNSLLM